jgi:hypothetical protein
MTPLCLEGRSSRPAVLELKLIGGDDAVEVGALFGAPLWTMSGCLSLSSRTSGTNATNTPDVGYVGFVVIAQTATR